ncbi:MAG TPA: hypothetical protein VN930_01300 [Xanthobacteraceae bacterium]|nr:hypothetical protein [Xanthobacteraceae bacterium]
MEIISPFRDLRVACRVTRKAGDFCARLGEFFVTIAQNYVVKLTL